MAFAANNALELSDLSCVRDGRCLFQGLNTQLDSAEILQIEGPNGSGKTTLLRFLTTLSSEYMGSICWNGVEIGKSGSKDYLQQLHYMGHQPAVKLSLTPLENLQGFVNLHGAKTEKTDAKGLKRACINALGKVGLSGYEGLPCYQLSAGQQRRVALAKLQLTPAPLWILDEQSTKTPTQAEFSRTSGNTITTQEHLNAAKNFNLLSQEASNKLIQQALREALPRQGSHSELLRALTQLTTSTKTSNTTSSSESPLIKPHPLLPSALQKNLDELLIFTQNKNTLSSPKHLQSLLQNSGLFLESKLVKKEAGTDKSVDSNLKENINDLKARLLISLEEIQQQLVKSENLSSARSVSKGSFDSILALLNQWQKSDNKLRDLPQTRQKLLQQVQSLIQSSLAKIQTQQLQLLSQKTNDINSPMQNFNIEIPIRIQDEIQHLSMEFRVQEQKDEEEHSNNEDNKQEKSKKVQHWQVIMDFQLQQYGLLTAQLSLIEERVKIKFWSDSNELTQRIEQSKAKLNQKFDDDGLNLEQWQCLQGKAPKRQTTLNYSLVDIET